MCTGDIPDLSAVKPEMIADKLDEAAGKPDVLNMTPEELRDRIVLLGEKPFRANQIYKWLYKGAVSFGEMTDLSAALIKKLDNHLRIGSVKETKRLISSDGRTTKYLYLLTDDNIIECVAMEYGYGTTLCLSTQVGCRMGCSFCASTTGGLVRHLTAGEMTAQVLAVNTELLSRGKGPLNGLVLMGSGEPLDNYSNTLKFLRLIHDPKGFNLGYRNITLSTCGLVPKIYELAEEDLSINLAVSLHAPNDDVRRRIMKIANAYSVKDIIKASKHYFEKTGRRVTFEYALIRDVNDTPELAKELAALLKGFACHVNLIPLNENEHSEKRRSTDDNINRFMRILEEAGVNATRRHEMGLDIQGACGQLKAAYLKKGGK